MGKSDEIVSLNYVSYYLISLMNGEIEEKPNHNFG